VKYVPLLAFTPVLSKNYLANAIGEGYKNTNDKKLNNYNLQY